MDDGDDPARGRERVLDALNSLSFAQKEFGRLFARAQEMHPTAAAAVVEILIAEDRGRPLSPARLAERIGLSPAATSALLNRLEEAGDVVRTREHRDRRIVTLHATAQIHDRTDAFYEPLHEAFRTAMADRSPAELDLVAEVVGQLRDIVTGFLDRPVRDDPAG